MKEKKGEGGDTGDMTPEAEKRFDEALQKALAKVKKRKRLVRKRRE